MKLVIRILNMFIMALSMAATVFLFAMPSFSFNSNIGIDVKKIAGFVPETEYTKDFDIAELIGTDTIHVGIKFSLNPVGLSKTMKGDRDAINEQIISKNVDDIVAELHTPVDLITDYSIRSIIKSTVKAEITKQVQEAADAYHSDSSAEDIMAEAEMDDVYFTNFANVLYNSMNQDDSTVDLVSDVLFEQIDEALDKAEGLGLVGNQEFTQERKDDIKTNLSKVLTDLNLVEADGVSLKKISQIPYIYFSDYLKKELSSKVDNPASLERKDGEAIPDYADRLIVVFVLTQMPNEFYQYVGYVSLGLFIGLFVFAAIWLFLFIWTLIRTFTKKPWTFFGPIFWIVGSLQIVLGLALTIIGKFILPTMKFSFLEMLPINSIVLAPRTYALIPSMLFIVCFVFAIGYFVCKIIAKRQYKKQLKEAQ